MGLRVPSCCEHGTGQCSAPAVSDTTHETLSSTLELELCLQDEERVTEDMDRIPLCFLPRCKMYFMIIFDIKESNPPPCVALGGRGITLPGPRPDEIQEVAAATQEQQQSYKDDLVDESGEEDAELNAETNVCAQLWDLDMASCDFGSPAVGPRHGLL
ncbi:hypothetical protein POTOM_033396 [Populus tomentosa]|uniref:Uncharacterized protein n=1 Tax=Populus tomentosa TaxID=118781 RepID=A0A8X7Z4A5_POPTO|nr:hypothetical protein POTOM_033396 [Populus tomentosa]